MTLVDDEAVNARLDAIRIRKAAWSKANRDKTRLYRKKSYAKNREKELAKNKERDRLTRIKKPEYFANVMRRYRERHPEKVAKAQKKYDATRRKEKAISLRAWRKKNPERVKEFERRRAEKHPNRRSESYAKNKEKEKAATRVWCRANPEKAAAINTKNQHKRRARKALSEDNYTLAQIRSLREAIGGKCALCRLKGRMTVDHIVPLARGGSNGIRNIQFLCKPCNSKKQDKDPIDFAQQLGMLL